MLCKYFEKNYCQRVLLNELLNFYIFLIFVNFYLQVFVRFKNMYSIFKSQFSKSYA